MAAHLDAVIDALLSARRTHGLSDATGLAHAVRTADDACLVQAAVANELGWFGDGVARYWKSGGASRSAVMTHSPLPPAGVWASPADARGWPQRLRLIEAEIAFRLGDAVDAKRAEQLDRDTALGVFDAMTVSIELVDSRWQQGLDAPAMLRMADQQSHSALVLGDWAAIPRAADWLAQACRVQIGERASEYLGTHACGDPAWGLIDWLRHATREGDTLPAGSVVTTGSWCGALPVHAGERVSVVFDGLGRAELQL